MYDPFVLWANDHAVSHLWVKTVLYNLRWLELVQQLWIYSVCKNIGAQRECPVPIGLPGQWPSCCISTGWDDSIEIQREWIGPAALGFRVTASTRSVWTDGQMESNLLRRSISCEIAWTWISQDPTDNQLNMVHVMIYCSQATSHYLIQCWPISVLPHGNTWLQ